MYLRIPVMWQFFSMAMYLVILVNLRYVFFGGPSPWFVVPAIVFTAILFSQGTRWNAWVEGPAIPRMVEPDFPAMWIPGFLLAPVFVFI